MGTDKADKALAEGMRDQAATWIARLRSDSVSEEDRQRFALWLAANPEHRRAMDTMLELWDDLAVTRHMPLTASPARPSRRAWIGGALAVAASVVLALFMAPGLELAPEEQIYRTRIGERVSVELTDGSTININTNSRLTVSLQHDLRRIVLSQGEAFFQVASDPDRPFVVEAGNAEVRALGTAFNVRLQGGVSRVTVTEGVVRVTERNAPPTRPPESALLYGDQQIAMGGAGLGAPAAADSRNSLAWRDGNLVADGMSLATLVQELSRYHQQKILIAEPELGQMSVSGVFRLEDPDTILRALEHSFELRAVALDDGTIQLIRAPL